MRETHVRTGAFALTWLPTIPANAQESTWGGTASTVSDVCLFTLLELPIIGVSHISQKTFFGLLQKAAGHSHKDLSFTFTDNAPTSDESFV